MAQAIEGTTPGEHFCEVGGYVVDAELMVPDDPTDYQKGGALLGCNRLRCAGCGELVRQQVVGAGRGRQYACRCRRWCETSYHACGDPEPDVQAGDPSLPWRCSGHPIATLPVVVDGERLDADTDLDELVTRVLTGWSPDRSPPPSPWSSSAWLYRVRARLADLPIAQELALAVARRLDEPVLRAGALAYFCGFPRDAGFDRVVRLAADPAVLHARAASRVKQGSGVMYWPAWALRCRLFSVRGAADALDRAAAGLLQQSWLRGDPGLEPEDLDALAWVDAPWIAASAAQIARADGARALPLLECLRERGMPELVAIAGVALAREPALDPAALRGWLGQWFNRDQVYVSSIQHALDSP